MPRKRTNRASRPRRNVARARPRRRNNNRFDPPAYSENPWNDIILDFTDTVSKSHDAGSDTARSVTEGSIWSSLNITLNQNETAYEFRMIEAWIWAEAYTMSNTGTDIANLSGITTQLEGRFNSLLGVPTSTASAPLEENRLAKRVDYPTRTRPAHVHFKWPAAHRAQAFVAADSTATNLMFWDVRDTSATGPWTSADQGFYWKYNARVHVVWRGKQDLIPTRAVSVFPRARQVAAQHPPDADMEEPSLA